MKYYGGTLTINEKTIKDIYDKIISENVSLLKSQLERLKNMKHKFDYVILAGGFSSCKKLTNDIKKMVKKDFKDINVIIIKDPGTAVLYGGALYMKNPNTISSRVFKETYGIEIFENLNNNHQLKYKVTTKDGDYCGKIFLPLVKQGEDVPNNYMINKKFKLYKDKKEQHISLFVTEKENYKYTDEEGENLIIIQMKLKLFLNLILE